VAAAARRGFGATAALGRALLDATATPRESSLAAVAVLAAAREDLDERRLVGTAASDLSTLAGATGARWVPPCEREDEKVKLSPT
jgi:hypothetical protein